MSEESDKAEKPEDTNEPAVITLDEVTMEKGTIDFQDKDGVISGNVYRGAVLRGNKNIAVEGEIAGVSETKAIIEIAGDVQVEQSVTGAKIIANNVVVSGDVVDSQIQAEGYLEVHGNLTNSQVYVGSRNGQIKKLNQRRMEVRTVEQKISELTVQTSSAGRKFVRDYPQVDLKMGNILVPLKRELRVRLNQFYSAVGETTPEKIDKSLEEFYLRVVVGMLTRNNRAYISRNPSRHKIFLKLIEELRLHILKIRDLDKLQDRKTNLSKGNNEILRNLKSDDNQAYVRVGGLVGEGVSVTLVRLKDFQETPSGMMEVDKSVIEGRITTTEDSDQLVLEVTGPGGKDTVTPPEGGFENGSFTVWEDDMLWQVV